ncbi:MAG: YbaK/EbsC family protein [Alphaproteobacteria bacterium]|nr:YbaK/EbsC family protein [Alphaproteobacteria bacterium]
MDDATGNPEPRAIAQVRRALAAAGLAARIVQMPASTRTAEEAAAACRCDVAQIVKSLVFRGGASGEPLLLLVSGRNRVDTAKVAATIGEALTRPDAQFVRDVTGFAIGGIPPLGHDRTLRTFVDPDLLAYPTVFAAAGTPNAIMELDPRALCTATGATIIPVT